MARCTHPDCDAFKASNVITRKTPSSAIKPFKLNLDFAYSPKPPHSKTLTRFFGNYLLDVLIESEKDIEKYYRKTVQFTNQNDHCIYRNIITDWQAIFINTPFNTKGKMPLVCNWVFYGIPRKPSSQCQKTFYKIATLHRTKYETKVVCTGALHIRDCRAVQCFNTDEPAP